MTPSAPSSLARASLLAAAALALLPAAHAQSTLFWDGGTTSLSSGANGASNGQSGTWDTTLTNWDTTSSYVAWVNSQNDIASFGGTSGTSGLPNIVTLGTAITAGGLSFNSNFYRITGSTLTLAGTPVITVSTGNTAEINSTLAGTNGFTKSGAGTLVLRGHNTFTGVLTLAGGTLRVGGGPTNASVLGLGSVNVSAATNIATSNSANDFAATIGNAISINSATTLTFDGGFADLMLNGVISGQGGIQNSSTGSVFLINSANTFSGGTRVNSTGTLWGSVIGTSGGGNGSFGSADTITYAAYGAIGYLGTGETVSKTLNFSTGSGGNFINHAASTSATAVTLQSITAASFGMGVTFNGGSNTVLANGISGSTAVLNFNKGGLGTLTVNGNLSGAAGSNIRAQGGVLILNSSNTTASGIVTERTSGAVIRFGSASNILTANTGTNGILGGWATWNGTDWASGNGTRVVSFTGSYVNDTWASGNNTTVTTNATQTGATTNSLRFNDAAARTVTLSGTNYLQSGGILVTAAVGANTTTITGGTLIRGIASTANLANTNDIIINNFNTSGGLTIGSIIANNTGTILTNLTVTGPGTTTLTGANTFTGNVFVHGGARLNVDSASGTLRRVYRVAADSSLYLKTGSGAAYGYGVVVHGAGAGETTRGLFLNGGQNFTFQSTLNLTGAPTTVRTYGTGNAGLTSFDTNGVHMSVDATASGSALTSNVVLSSSNYGYVLNVAAGINTATGDLVVNSALRGNAGNGTTLTIAGGTNQKVDYQVNKSGARGSIRFNATGNPTNGVWLRAGSIIAGANNILGTGKGLVLGDAANSGKLILNGFSVNLGNLGIQGTGTANAVVGGSSTLSTLTLSSANAISFAGFLGGVAPNDDNLALVKSGAGTLTLTASSTHLGGTTVNAGTLALGNAINTLADTGAVDVDGATAILSLDANSDTLGALTLRNGGSVTGTTGVLSASSFALESGSVSAILSGSGALAKSTAGTVTLSGANTFTGGSTLSAGTLSLSGSGTLGSGSASVASGAILGLNREGDFTLANVVTGAGTLAKSQSGTATLSGSLEDFTGSLAVNAGSLVYTGSGALGYTTATVAAGANLTVAAGHTVGDGRTLNLRGSSVNDASASDFTGDLSVTGGVLNVGGTSTVGTALVTGNFSVGSASTVNFDLATVATIGAGSSDLLRVSGDVAFASGATLNLVAGSLDSATYRLITYTGSLSGFDNLSIAYNSGAATRSTFTKIDNAADKAIEVLVGSASANLRWTGSDSQAWDITTTSNFTNLGLDVVDQFFTGDNVAFDGLGAGTVTLASGLVAGTVAVSGTADYTLSGASGLGVTTLTKSGSSKLTLATALTVAGSGSVTGGILEIGTGGSYAGALTIGADSTLTQAAGTLSGTLGLSGGTINLNAGTASSALTVNSGTVTVAGATLSGAVTINAGTLSLTSGSITNQIAMVDGALSLTGGTASGGLVATTGSVTIAGTALSGAVTINGGTLALTSGSISSLITFAGSTASLTGGTASGGLTVTAGAATLNGTTLTGPVAVNGGTLSYLTAGTFANNHTVGASGEFILNLASGTQTFTGTLAGSGLISKRGAGTLILNPVTDSTFGGSLVVESGILQLSDGSVNAPNTFTSGAAATATITVKSGAILELPRLHSGSQTITWADLPSVTLEGGSTLRFRASVGNDFHNTAFNLAVSGGVTINNNGGSYDHDITHAGAVTGTGTINYFATSDSGGGTYQRTLTLTLADNAFTGDWFVDYTAATADDHLELRSNAAGSLGTGNVILDDRARLINNASGGINSLAGVSLLKATSNLNLAAQGWSNTAATLSIAAGTVSLGAATNSIGNLSGAGGTIEAGNAASALTINQTTDATYGGIFASTVGSSLALTKTGSATLTLTGASTAAGSVAINGGKVVLSGGDNRLSTAANITVGAGATLEIASTNALRRQDPATQGTVTLDGGTLLLSGSSTSGAHLGALTLANGGSLAATFDAGSYFGWNFNLNGDVTVSGTSNSTISASIGLLGSRTFNVADVTSVASTDLTISGAIRDSDTVAGALVKTGAGTLYLSAASAYTGGTTVSAGSLVIGNVASLGTGAVTLSTGGLLDLAGLNPLNTVIFAGGTVQNEGAWTGTAALTAGSYEATDLNGLAGGSIEVRTGTSVDLSGVTKDIFFTGGSVSGLDAYTNTLSVTGGTLDLSAIDFSFAPLGGTLEVRTGGTVAFGQGLFDGEIIYRGGTIGGDGVAQFDALVTGANVTLAPGAITGSGGEFVIGTGQSAVLGAGLTDTVRLAGGSINGGLLGPTGFGGLLIVEGQGVLTLANPTSDPSLAGPQFISLRDGGKLAGVGDLGEGVVAAGGILAPGNSPGTLVFTGLQLETLGILQFEIASVLAGEASLDGQPIAGEQYDTVNVGGVLDLANLSPTQRFLLELISLDGFNSTGFAPEGWDDNGLYTFTLIDYSILGLGTNTPGADGDITNLFTIDSDGFLGASGESIVSASFRVLVDTDNSRLVLTYAPIPEPSTYGLIIGALALAGAAVRRRRKLAR
jgi:autotransporter-associated beta strand protein